MPDFTQFPDETDIETGAVSINFSFPVEPDENQTPQEAIEEWLDETGDEELGRFVRRQTWEYWR